MGKFKDLTGQKFGRLTVVERAEDYVSSSGLTRRLQWKCLCDCGNKEFIIVASNNLTSGHTSSCGCLKNISPNFENIVGMKFGRWTVIKREENSKNNNSRWLCLCDCQKNIPDEEKEFYVLSTNILKSGKSKSCGCLQKELLRISKRNNKYSLKDHSENNDNFWKYSIGENIETKTGNITITKRYYENGGNIKNYVGKYYYYKCNICGYECDDKHIILESNINSGSGCARCAGRDSDIFATKKIFDYAKWMIPYLKNVDDANVYGISSKKYIDVVCPECGYEDSKKISSMYNGGFHCYRCSDGISYPEKFMIETLKQLKINFIYQLSKRHFDWIDKFRYDFYIPDLNMIIETHGGQHYYEGFSVGRTLYEEQINDEEKRILL